MAFDQATRNRLARFVSDARSLLTEEFTRQLQHEYGLDPISGDVTPLERLTALDDSRRETAHVLRETMDYYLAGNPTSDGKAHQEVLDRIVREQAFTVLNRLCALRMAEGRGLVLESIANGYQSKGFLLYAQLARSALGETGDAYRGYLFSIMDEFSVDLPVLFDRFSPQGRLFPRETALLRLLGLINAPEIDLLWIEDETIGWIYQYFNSKEERKAMRDASQTPRNSRELAVRNQFFTPRYVVEFLTDNTLGRIWYEMTQGETVLKDTCRYLVRRPNEIFLKEGEQAPIQPPTEEDLSQEEMLKQPVYIAFRALKDPRELKMIDLACGSMHFGLYAFDLFEQIYNEAWDMEEQMAVASQQHNAGINSLHRAYTDKASFLRDVPRLIIERNIHGIDIDPRAVQIAGLSLWLRAQKSWQAQGLKAHERPQIRRSNVVCAEPMPGDRALLEEFLATLHEDKLESLMRQVWHVPSGQKIRATKQMADALAKLVRTVWQEMELAGEAGSLLKIEETLREAIATARKESEEKSPLFRMLEFGMNEPAKEQYVQLISGEDQDFFDRAEELVLAALHEYAEQAENGSGYRRKLFAGDAVQGFAFIDLCRKQYDVVLMNPPFGHISWKPQIYCEAHYKYNNDLYTMFLERGMDLIVSSGFEGAITSRTYLHQPTFLSLRKQLLSRSKVILEFLVEMGIGVLDDATVRVALSVFRKDTSLKYITAIGLRDSNNFEQDLYHQIEEYKNGFGRAIWIKSESFFMLLPGYILSYWIPWKIANLYGTLIPLGEESLETPINTIGNVRVGLSTGDDFRFIRLWTEVSSINVGKGKNWRRLLKGGEFRPFENPSFLLINWKNGGGELRTYDRCYFRNEKSYEKPGIICPYISDKGIGAQPFPSDHIFSHASRFIELKFGGTQYFYALLALLNSNIYNSFLASLTAERSHESRILASLPIPSLEKCLECGLAVEGKKIVENLSFIQSIDEISPLFAGLNYKSSSSITELKNKIQLKLKMIFKDVEDSINSIDEKIPYVLGISNFEKMEFIDLAYHFRQTETSTNSEEENSNTGINSVISSKLITNNLTRNLYSSNLSYWIGCVYGRWDIRYSIDDKFISKFPELFNQLPTCSPGMLQNENGLPSVQKDISIIYPLRITWSGILVDDEGHIEDIDRRLRDVLHIIWQKYAETIEQEICHLLSIHSLREYFRKPGGFFAEHLKRYSKSRRAAPIYWPLSTPSCSYTLWLYYHRLNDQTLFTCVNDFVDPKLKQVSEEASRLRLRKGRSAADEKELEWLTDFERELKDFREELLRVAKFWKPNLNDGVEITAAPLWKLFQHKPWQKRLKETWQKLEAGEYDWAHLAYSIWQERVRDKCKTDKSLAIAHDLESLYVETKTSPKKKRSEKQTVDEDIQGRFNDD